jgi:hypothetical protein
MVDFGISALNVSVPAVITVIIIIKTVANELDI